LVQELVILSGKGGTGKTSLAGCFAALAGNKVLADCDVDAADLHLLLAPTVRETYEFRSGQAAVIDRDACTECGRCAALCRFDAIHDFTADPLACEGCGLCALACPAGAITMEERLAGHRYRSETAYGPLVHARLGIGEENSGKLVTEVRRAARDLAEREGLDLIICDGPPGIGCPVISSLSGADLALLVTEPTLSGVHDLERVVGVCRHFGVAATVCINKYDLNENNSRHIEAYCEAKDIPVVGRLPYDTAVTEAIAQGQPLVSYRRDGIARDIEDLWDKLAGQLSAGKGETPCRS
jgi:MinD superfamily P-loop ATPase